MPGLVCLVSVPLILYVLFPPEVKDTPDAPAKARCCPGSFSRFRATSLILVPGLVCLVSVPLILYVLFPPEVKDTPDAPAKARCGPSPVFRV